VRLIDCVSTPTRMHTRIPGALVKTVSNIAKQHNPPLNITLLDGWASQQSQDYFPSSSYTACVMDVVVGKVDICIADFWVTPERLSFDAEFLIAFGSDGKLSHFARSTSVLCLPASLVLLLFIVLIFRILIHHSEACVCVCDIASTRFLRSSA